MCPEYGATVAIFPIDDMTLDYLRLTGRDESQRALVEAYATAQGLFRTPTARRTPMLLETLELDLVDDRAEPGRPEAAAGSRVAVKRAKRRFRPRCPTMQVPAEPSKVDGRRPSARRRSRPSRRSITARS